MKKVLHESYISVRKMPKNLSSKDLPLFEHEETRSIKSSYFFDRKSIFIFNSIVISFRGLTYFKNYTFFGDKTLIERIKRIVKAYRDTNKKNTVLLEKGIWFTDHKSHVYFHWLFDSLQRAMLVVDKNKNLPLLVPEELFKKDYISQSLKFLNLNYIVLKSNNIYKVKRLTLTSKTALSGNYNEKILASLVQLFKKNSKTTDSHSIIKNTENLFIYRNRSVGRDIYNFDELQKILFKYDYSLIKFEDYSYSEKIQILGQCKNLVGMFGSGLSNMIFLNEGSNLIEIRHKNDSKNNAFFSLASALNLNYYYESFSLTDKGCVVDIKNIDNLLKKLQ